MERTKKTERTVHSIIEVLKSKGTIRHLSQEGCHVSFFLHGIRCSLIIKNQLYYMGVELGKGLLADLSCEKLSELTLLLSGDKGVPNINIFISDYDELCIFTEKKSGNIFDSDKWFDEYEKMLVVRLLLIRALTRESRTGKMKPADVSHKWIAV